LIYQLYAKNTKNNSERKVKDSLQGDTISGNPCAIADVSVLLPTIQAKGASRISEKKTIKKQLCSQQLKPNTALFP
jgi:hypothetical protein